MSALIVLPGVIALLLGQRMGSVLAIAIATGLAGTLGGLAGTLGGLAIHQHARYIPIGPAMALLLFLQFVPAYVIARLRRS